MTTRTPDEIRSVTRELTSEILREMIDSPADLEFPRHPHETGDYPTWRLRFDLTDNSQISGGVDLNGEVVLGRGQGIPGFSDLLKSVDLEQRGVSRNHAMLRPTESKLYLLDLGSTNHTWINSHSIGVNMPYSLSSGDIVRMGRLEFTVTILKHPGHSASVATNTDPFEILPTIARSITSQLDLKDVLEQTVATTMSYTPADEVTIWLVDEYSGELFLESGQGMDDGQIQRLPVADTLAGQVVQSGKPMRVNRESDGEQIKLKTGYMVEAVIYVPLSLGGTTFGVLSAAHREKGKMFSPQDEKIMIAIADLTASAVQNARMHQATARSLMHRTKVLTALNYALGYNLKSLINSTIGHAGLLRTDDSLSSDTLEIVGDILTNGDAMIELLHRLNDVASLTNNFNVQHTSFDLVDVVNRAREDLDSLAKQKSIRMDFQFMGNPYLIQGDAVYIHRVALNLIDNAVRYSPPQSRVTIMLVYSPQEVILRVRDNGAGIPESDLPYIFDHYVRGEQSTGIGLGLYLVRAVVEAHQGTVVAHNAADGGAELTVMLPGKLKLS